MRHRKRTNQAKRERDRLHDAKRRNEKPWRSWYFQKEWKAIRARRLAVEPWCRLCAKQGKKVKATVVDHVIEHKGDRELFFDFDNTQSLDEHCHNALKQSLERSRFRAVGNDGWPLPDDGRGGLTS